MFNREDRKKKKLFRDMALKVFEDWPEGVRVEKWGNDGDDLLLMRDHDNIKFYLSCSKKSVGGMTERDGLVFVQGSSFLCKVDYHTVQEIYRKSPYAIEKEEKRRLEIIRRGKEREIVDGKINKFLEENK